MSFPSLLKTLVPGLFLGGITCALFASAYAVEKTWFFHPGLYWGSFLLIPIGFLLLVRWEKRQERKDAKSLLKSFFLLFFLNSLCYNAFYLAMLHSGDGELLEIQYQLIQDKVRTEALPKDGNDSNVWKIDRQDLKENLRPTKMLLGFAQGLLPGFMLSFLFAQLLKISENGSVS